MKNLLQDFTTYVTKVAGRPVSCGAPVSKSLPQYLTRQYALHKITIGGQTFLGIVLKDAADFRPAAFVKHLRQLMADAAGLDGYCLIARNLPGYTRRRLVERQIPFATPGQQMYWPELGLAAQARKAGKAPVPVEALSPAAQAVLIYALNGKITAPATPRALAAALGYTDMTMSRALDELEANELGRVVRRGRERLLSFPDERRILWQAALPYMRDPARKTARIQEAGLPPGNRMKAGQTALAELSLLAPPGEPVYAVDRRAWKKIAETAETVPVEDEGTCRVQVWRYDPALCAGHGRVDPFSLFLNLREEKDERVEAALEEMMEKIL